MTTPTADRKLIVLFDGSAVFHRGFHALPPMTNREGVPTNAVLGFANIVIKVLGDLKPDYAVVAWDKSSKTFRNRLYPEYKAQRAKMPDDLRVQIPFVRELVAGMGLQFNEVEDYEADDIIGTLAQKAEAEGLRVVIATGDRDQLQLITGNVVVDMFNPRGSEPTRYDLAKMDDKYGLTPAQFIDYKALLGDSSDNIPGLPGIGDVGARKLLGAYQTLDGIYEHADEITGKIGQTIRDNKELAYKCQELSRIVLDAPVELDLGASRVGGGDRDVLTELFHRLDLRSLLAKIPTITGGARDASRAEGVPALPKGATPTSGPLTLFGDDQPAVEITDLDAPDRKHLESVTYHTVATPEALGALVSGLKGQDWFAFDTETTSVDTYDAKLVGLSFSWKEAEAYYIPVGHLTETGGLASGQLSLGQVLDALRPVFEDAAPKKTGHNIKYDVEVLARHGVRVAGIGFDTMVAAFLINSAGRSQSLDDLAYNELGIQMIPISELIGKGKAQINFSAVPIEAATTYAGEDADISWRLYQLLTRQLAEAGLARLGDDMEWPLIPVLSDMELAGITLDVGRLKDFGRGLERELADTKAKIYDLAGEEFNLGSPAQLANILYGRLGLSTAGLKKGKTGFSTAAPELEKLRGDHPIVELVMRHREYDKLMSTYVDALPELVKDDGRIHTSFNQTIAQTGRLSSTNPNLQNIPVRTELGRRIREAFVAPKGYKLVSADYSQIELRVAAALARDERMIETFKKGIDLHQQTAAELFGVPLEAVTKEQRYNSKTINFGVLYGMSAHGLSVATGMGAKEAAEFIQRYFEVRPKLRDYIDDTKRFAHEKLYTATLFGRRRPCPEIRSSNFQIRQGAERVAVNVPIQGTAADIYKLAMIAVAGKLDDDCKLLLQIHDELIVEAPEAKAEAVAKLLRETMEGVYDIGVPLAVDTAIGDNWGQL